MNEDLLVTLIVPAYNEGEKLYANMEAVIRRWQGVHPFELIVVDDGSRDATAAQIRRLEDAHREVRGLVLPRNLGKGAALRAGTAMAQGEVIVYYDADLEIPVDEVARLTEMLITGKWAAVVGNKKACSRTPARRLLTAVFRLTCALLWPGLPDSQTGLKVFRRGPLLEALTDTRLDRYLFELELVLALSRRTKSWEAMAEADVEAGWNRRSSRIGILALGQCALEFWSILRRFGPRGGPERWRHVQTDKGIAA